MMSCENALFGQPPVNYSLLNKIDFLLSKWLLVVLVDNGPGGK